MSDDISTETIRALLISMCWVIRDTPPTERTMKRKTADAIAKCLTILHTRADAGELAARAALEEFNAWFESVPIIDPAATLN